MASVSKAVNWPPEGQVSAPDPAGCGHGDRVCAVEPDHKCMCMSNRISI